MKRKISQNTIKFIKTMYEESAMDISLIGQILGVSEQTIRKYAKNENWNRKFVEPKPIKDIELAIECYKDGVKLMDILEMSGINNNELYEEIDSRNIERRTSKSGERNKVDVVMKAQLIAKTIGIIRENPNVSLSTLEKELGANRYQLRVQMKKLGLL